MATARSALNFVGGISDRFMTRIPRFMLHKSDVPRDEYLSRLRFYVDWPTGRGFFPLPASAPEHELLEVLPIPGGERALYRYGSHFEGHSPAMVDALASYAANQYGYLHVWRHRESAATRPLVLCIHGFGMAGPRRAEQMFKIGRMFEQGLDVALHHLPHHWRRSEHPPNSQLLRPQDVPLTLEEWVRNIHDLHSAVWLLRGLGYDRIGMIGASLGGLTAALYATAVQPNAIAPVDFIFLVVPAVDLGGFLEPRPGLMDFDADEEVRALTREALMRIVPTHYEPTFDVSRIGVVAHQGDRICPIGPTRELVQRWRIEHYTEVVGGHWVYLDRKVRGRTWYAWLTRMGYLPERT